MQRRPSWRREGSAVLMVLILAILLLLAALALWRANETQETQVETNLARIQAEYLAKGGHQLALLKARLMPQPLLHASHYAVGRNPFYPHTQGYAHLNGASRGANDSLVLSATDPDVGSLAAARGPAFFFDPDQVTADPNNRDFNFDGPSASDVEVVERHLTRFRADLADSTNAGGGQLRIQLSEGSADPILGAPDPYNGTFAIDDMRILGGRQNQAYSEDAMLVNCVASVDSMVSGIRRTWSAAMRRIYRVNRD